MWLSECVFVDIPICFKRFAYFRFATKPIEPLLPQPLHQFASVDSDAKCAAVLLFFCCSEFKMAVVALPAPALPLAGSATQVFALIFGNSIVCLIRPVEPNLPFLLASANSTRAVFSAVKTRRGRFRCGSLRCACDGRAFG